MWKKKQKGCKSQRWWRTPRKQYPPSTTEVIHIWTHRDSDSMHKTFTDSNQTKILTLRRRYEQNSTLAKNLAICNWYLLREGKSVICYGGPLGVSTRIDGRPRPRSNLANTKRYSIFRRREVVLVFIFVWLFHFILFLLVLLKRTKEKKDIRMGG